MHSRSRVESIEAQSLTLRPVQTGIARRPASQRPHVVFDSREPKPAPKQSGVRIVEGTLIPDTVLQLLCRAALDTAIPRTARESGGADDQRQCEGGGRRDKGSAPGECVGFAEEDRGTQERRREESATHEVASYPGDVEQIEGDACRDRQAPRTQGDGAAKGGCDARRDRG